MMQKGGKTGKGSNNSPGSSSADHQVTIRQSKDTLPQYPPPPGASPPTTADCATQAADIHPQGTHASIVRVTAAVQQQQAARAGHTGEHVPGRPPLAPHRDAPAAVSRGGSPSSTMRVDLRQGSQVELLSRAEAAGQVSAAPSAPGTPFVSTGREGRTSTSQDARPSAVSGSHQCSGSSQRQKTHMHHCCFREHFLGSLLNADQGTSAWLASMLDATST